MASNREAAETDVFTWLESLGTLDETQLDALANIGLDSFGRLQYATLDLLRTCDIPEPNLENLLQTLSAHARPDLPPFTAGQSLETWLAGVDLGQHYDKLQKAELRTPKSFAAIMEQDCVLLQAGVRPALHRRHLTDLARVTGENLAQATQSRKRKLQLKRKPVPQELDVREQTIRIWLTNTNLFDKDDDKDSADDRDCETVRLARALAKEGVDSLIRIGYVNEAMLDRLAVDPKIASQLLEKTDQERSKHKIRGLLHGEDMNTWLTRYDLKDYIPMFHGHRTRSLVSQLLPYRLSELGISKPAIVAQLTDMIAATKAGQK